MDPLEVALSHIRITRADHLLVAAAFCRRLELIQTVNRVVPSGMAVDVGTVVQGLVLDTLSGRSPLYRLAEFFEQQDTGLLLGTEVAASAFNDTTVARAMDEIYAVGAGMVFAEVAFHALTKRPQDLRILHWDSTSVNVWGDYRHAGPDSERLAITYGFSKDHRPDLKQFLIETLCVGGNVPVLGGCRNGNASDKALNNALLSRLAAHLAKHGLGAGDFLYVADAALVTEANLQQVGANLFVTRLPFAYDEANRVVAAAVAAARWEDVGVLAETPATAQRPAARYRVTDTSVQLYGKTYRAVVVHSSAHDRRRQKRIARELQREAESLATQCRQQSRQRYFCRADAQAAADRLTAQDPQFHHLSGTVVEKPCYPPGRPPRNHPRPVVAVHYFVQAKFEPEPTRLARRHAEAGCFVLLSNVPLQGPHARSAADLLRAYKDQHAIERNFSFLKDPLIVNDLFLKKPERIEVLGAILLIALLVWNLLAQALRQHVTTTGDPLPGWDRKLTTRPTTFMLTTKFAGLQVVRFANHYRLARPLTPTQEAYLQALDLSLDHLLPPLPGAAE